MDVFEQVNTSYRFMDHYPCPLDMLRPFCKSVEKYLEEDERNVVAIHCKAGKGRTGLMICVLLVHLYKMTPQEALDLFAEKRTHNRKGVTIPSQWRYVFYYHRMQQVKINASKEYRISHVRLNTVPSFDLGGGCCPYFKVYMMWTDVSGKLKEDLVFNYSKKVKPKYVSKNVHVVDLDCSKFDLVVKGDVKIVFYDANQITKHEKMFHFVFHTGFVERNYLMLSKKFIDKACKDKDNSNFDENFHLEIFFDAIKDDGDLKQGDTFASSALPSMTSRQSRVESSLYGDATAHSIRGVAEDEDERSTKRADEDGAPRLSRLQAIREKSPMSDPDLSL